jgi:hypothetical protein
MKGIQNMSIASLLTGEAIYVHRLLGMGDERWGTMKRKIICICVLVIAILLGSFYLIQNFYFVSKSASTVPTMPKLVIYHGKNAREFGDRDEKVKIWGGIRIFMFPLTYCKKNWVSMWITILG